MLLQAEQDRLEHRLYLAYSNRRRERAAFLDELQALARRNPRFVAVLLPKTCAAKSSSATSRAGCSAAESKNGVSPARCVRTRTRQPEEIGCCGEAWRSRCLACSFSLRFRERASARLHPMRATNNSRSILMRAGADAPLSRNDRQINAHARSMVEQGRHILRFDADGPCQPGIENRPDTSVAYASLEAKRRIDARNCAAYQGRSVRPFIRSRSSNEI
jgi:hypothetical protein